MSNDNGTEVKRKKGRPRTGRKPKLAGRWVPKEWLPIYEEIVRLSATGLSNTDLAERYDYTKEQISNIITQDKARLIRASILNDIQGAMQENVHSRLAKLANKCIERIEETVYDDELAANHRFTMAQTSFTFLKGIGTLKSGDGPSLTVNNSTVNNTQNNQLILSQEAQERLAKGLEEVSALTNALPLSVLSPPASSINKKLN